MFLLYNKSDIDQAFSVEVAGYKCRSRFSVFMEIKHKKELTQYLAILTSRLVNDAYEKLRYFRFFPNLEYKMLNIKANLVVDS